MFGGNFRKFGTDSNGISGTFCAFALVCAKLGAAARSSPAASAPAVKHLFIEASGTKVEGIYTSASNGSSLAHAIRETDMLGLRLNDEERRHTDRRASARGTRDRRRGERRRARLRNLVFTGLALAVPHQTSHGIVWKLPPPPLWLTGPRVSTSIDSIVPIEPARAYDSIIADAAKTYRVDGTLIRSVMNAESGFDPSAVSRAGAMGLMQIMPEIAETFGVEHPFDPRENIMAGARLLRELLDQHQGVIPLVLASYNAGPSAVADWGGVVPPFAETQGYVKRVTGLIADARRGDTEN